MAGPYRSGTNDDPALIAKSVEAMTEAALLLFRAGHLPVMGEWFALPLIQHGGSAAVGDAVPLPAGQGHDFFYRFPNRGEPVRKAGYVWNLADQPVQDVMDSQFNEVALDYNAGFTSSLAWLTARGLSSGTALPEAEFPPQDERNQVAGLKTTDREFFVTARRLSEDATATEIEATVSGAETARLSAVRQGTDKSAFVEISFPDDAIHPGSLKAAQRTVKLRLSAPQWACGNDWSNTNLTGQSQLQPRLPVYDQGTLVGGEAP